MKVKEFMTRLARDAGKMALRLRKPSLLVKEKGIKDLVTEADTRIEDLIIRRIRKEYPGHAIVSEESGAVGDENRFTWYIDPVDGTVNYAHDIPVYCISIALAEDDEIVAGAVYAPALDQLFYAEKGKGAYLNGKKIKVTGRSRMAESLVFIHSTIRDMNDGLNVPLFDFFSRRSLSTRAIGSCALELCYVAGGMAEAVVKAGQHPWDFAAGMLIAEEAGGRVTDFRNRKIKPGTKCDIVATNSILHSQVLEIIGHAKGENIRPAIFLDRDGTLNIDDGKTYSEMSLKLFPRVIEGLRALQDKGYLLVVITNQGGIEAGSYTEAKVREMNRKLVSELDRKGIVIHAVYFCPHDNHGRALLERCVCGKPNTGMLEDAMFDLGIDMGASWIIGDKTSDVKTGENAGIRTILVKTGEAGSDNRYKVNPDYTASDLLDASQFIISKSQDHNKKQVRKVVSNGKNNRH